MIASAPVIAALVATAIVLGILFFSRFSKSDAWLATVTPLASIIGSGFLISGPVLAKEFGWAAVLAMAVLLSLAYAIGGVIRFNIGHVEPLLADKAGGAVRWISDAARATLAIAYAISVAYYLKLLAAFVSRAAGVEPPLYSKLLVTGILAALVVLAFTGTLRRVEEVTRAAVSIKLALIAAMLAALAADWAARVGNPLILPRANVGLHSVGLLLGLLIAVQGFETSRYMGELYGRELRIRTMRRAQLISSAIYIGFLLLLTPHLGDAARTTGIAGILDVMEGIAPILSVVVLTAAVASQLSAAVADSVAGTGLEEELSGKRLSLPAAYLAATLLSVAVVWLTNPFDIVAVASRAFAVFYAIQCVLALIVGRKAGLSGPKRAGVAVVLLICIAAALVGAPAE